MNIHRDRARHLISHVTSNTRELNLYGCLIGVSATKELLDLLAPYKTLALLELGRNHLGDDGAMVVAEAMKRNETPKTIHLDVNDIGDEGAKALARAIEVNTSVERLCLSGNRIGDEGAKALAAALPLNHTLETFTLGWNEPLTDAGGSALVNTVSQSFVVRDIYFDAPDLRDAIHHRYGVERRRCIARRTLLAIMRHEGVERESPLARFLDRDGDHAVASRVLGFLMPVAHTS